MTHTDNLSRLYNLGAFIAVDGPNPWGSNLYYLSELEAVEYISNPDQVLARQEGVSVEVYRAWKNADFLVRCSAMTKQKKQCKRIVPNGCQERPQKWLKLQGEYCAIHGP